MSRLSSLGMDAALFATKLGETSNEARRDETHVLELAEAWQEILTSDSQGVQIWQQLIGSDEDRNQANYTTVAWVNLRQLFGHFELTPMPLLQALCAFSTHVSKVAIPKQGQRAVDTVDKYFTKLVASAKWMDSFGIDGLIHVVRGVVTQLMVESGCDPLALPPRYKLAKDAPMHMGKWLNIVNSSPIADSQQTPTSQEMESAINRSHWLHALQHIAGLAQSKQPVWSAAAEELRKLLSQSHVQLCTFERSPAMIRFPDTKRKAFERLEKRMAEEEKSSASKVLTLDEVAAHVPAEEKKLLLENEYAMKKDRATEDGKQWAILERQRRELQLTELVSEATITRVISVVLLFCCSVVLC
jgi:hypothetical protein